MKSKIVTIVSIIVLCTGCSNRSNIFAPEPDIEIRGNAEGMRAFADMQTGILRVGREDPMTASDHIAFRVKQEKEVTKRETAPSFLSQLFKPSTAPTVGTVE